METLFQYVPHFDEVLENSSFSKLSVNKAVVISPLLHGDKPLFCRAQINVEKGGKLSFAISAHAERKFAELRCRLIDDVYLDESCMFIDRYGVEFRVPDDMTSLFLEHNTQHEAIVSFTENDDDYSSDEDEEEVLCLYPTIQAIRFYSYVSPNRKGNNESPIR